MITSLLFIHTGHLLSENVSMPAHAEILSVELLDSCAVLIFTFWGKLVSESADIILLLY